MAGMLIMLLISGCERSPGPQSGGPSYSAQPAGSDKPTYSFAVHPLHNPKRLFERYQPLIDHLNKSVPEANFALEASRDYQDFERKFRERKPAFILPNPWQTLEAIKVGYRVQAMAGDPEDFKGIFIVRRDGGIRSPADLKGKSVSYPSPTALAACILPQYWLHEQGIDINRDIDNRYVGSQESAIMNAFLKETAAGATWPPPWRAFQKEHPREAAELVQIWETASLPNNSVMARDDVPASLAAKVREVLAGLEHAPEGKAVLANMETARFHLADNDTYTVVRTFIAHFEKTVRPVEQH
ncbi:MAG: phosphate/phosphite/phosphonate ABC transporter substrate-binding protein [Pseudomonadota bacterium]